MSTIAKLAAAPYNRHSQVDLIRELFVAIRFRCACGKSMQAKDDFAGRRYKCPQCERIVRIPTPKAKEKPAAAAPDVAAKAAPAPPQVVAKPAAAPVAKPVTMPPLAKPVPARPTTIAAPRPHPWVDHSLVQTPTPWLPGDETRFQAGVKPMREELKLWEKALVLGVLVAAGVVVAFVT